MFGSITFLLYLCIRKWDLKRLVAHLQVFIEQFIAERGIEYGLQFVTQFFLNSPDCLYLKKSYEFLQSYDKIFKLIYLIIYS